MNPIVNTRKNGQNGQNIKPNANTKNAIVKNAILKNVVNASPSLTTKITEIAKGAVNKATNLGQKVTDVATNIKQKVTNKVANATTKVKAAPITEQVSKMTAMTKEFMAANSAISKFVAIVLSLLLFYILFNIGASFITSFYTTKNTPAVLKGLINSTSQKIISSDPNVVNAVPILRSVNKNQGLEFTWDLWFFIKNIKPMQNSNKYSLLFSKGTAGTPTPLVGAPMMSVCPGAYITYTGNSAQLVIVLNTFMDDPKNSTATSITGNEMITIPNIPISKWVHCAIRVQNKSVDVYINGVMTQRKNLLTLPKQNYYDTYVGDANGFIGYISSLNYYDRALNYDEIQRDYIKGPNMKMSDDNTSINYKDYLSMNWYYN